MRRFLARGLPLSHHLGSLSRVKIASGGGVFTELRASSECQIRAKTSKGPVHPNKKIISPVPDPRTFKANPRKNKEDYVDMNGGEILEKKLREYGVDTVFGFTGGAILPVTDAFWDSPIRFVNNASEQCSGHCAEGFAKVVRNANGMHTGVVMATSGPGVTNLVTALQDALTDSVPIIAFVGQVPSAAVGTDAFQECLTCDITRPCTKWNYQVKKIEEFPDIIDKAFRVAHTGKKGPVLIDLPKDVMVSTFPSESNYHCKDFIPYIAPSKKSIDDFNAIIELINGAERPIIIAGQGANQCVNEVLDLVNTNIPICTTLHAMGLVDETHHLSLEMLGMHGTAYANCAVQEADLILALGYRFDDRTTGVISQYAPEARKAEKLGKGGIIHFDIEEKQINKIVQSTHYHVGDVKDTLQDLLPHIKKQPREDWMKRIADLKVEHPLKWTPCEDPTHIKVQEVIYEMNKYLLDTNQAEKVVWSTGVGNHQMMCAQFVTWKWPQRMLSSGSLGTMGVGVPFAVGAHFARPDLICICIDGDASFQMTSNDLRTLAEWNIPVKIAIMNDFKQQMVHIWQTIYFEQRYLITENYNPDFCKLADAYGIKSLRVNNKSELKDGIKEFIEYKDGPIICDFRVQPDMCTPMVAPGAALDDMILDPSGIMRLESDPKNVPG